MLPLKELRQVSMDWARSLVRRATTLTESNSILRKVFLCTGESLLFSQMTRAPGPCDRTTVLVHGPCSRQLRILMPTSRNGASVPSVTFAKTRGDRESPKGRTLYYHAQPSNTNRRSVSRVNRDMKVRVLQVDHCKPILGLDASDDALLRQHLERKLVQGSIQDSQIQDWPEATTFLRYDELRAVKPLLLLGWRNPPDCILCQEDNNLLAQDRCVSDCHRSLENAAELGRLNWIA